MKIESEQHNIIVVRDAFRVATEEAVFWKKKGKEAGGSLVGVQNQESSTILYAFPTGPNADQSGCHIATDATFQNLWLGKTVRRYQNLKYLADWHLHPMYLPGLSQLDKDSCCEILSDPDHSYLIGLPLIIITFRGLEKPIHVPFWITMMKGRVDIGMASLNVVSPDHKSVVAALNGMPYIDFKSFVEQETKKERQKGIKKATDVFTGVFAGDTLRHRMEIEKAEIKLQFGVEPYVTRSASGCLCMSITVLGSHLVAVIPSEFPLNPPLVFEKCGKESRFQEHMPRYAWNSCARIADLFVEVMREKEKMGETQGAASRNEGKKDNEDGDSKECVRQHSRVCLWN